MCDLHPKCNLLLKQSLGFHESMICNTFFVLSCNSLQIDSDLLLNSLVLDFCLFGMMIKVFHLVAFSRVASSREILEKTGELFQRKKEGYSVKPGITVFYWKTN